MEGDHIRDYLKRADAALDGIGAAAMAAAVAAAADPATFRPFVATLDEDARKARAALKLAEATAVPTATRAMPSPG